ncbi:MAG TPA: aminotransferase class I/II-fold pyridoxal phosphate-dependent enzyme [Acidimicrobiales bacterium]|nr:aminotransferase class I/II-fold pyridoxal phosphate-dependent enzyme [Acidimicrobiales bacterium]
MPSDSPLPGAVGTPVTSGGNNSRDTAQNALARPESVAERGGQLSSDLERFDLEELGRRRSGKWQRDDPSAIAAGVAEMDFPLAPAVQAVLADLVARSDLGYPRPADRQAVREAFVRRWDERHGLSLDLANVALATDVVQAIHLCLATCTPPGTGVAMLTPAYPPFFSAIEGTGRRVVGCDLVATERGYALDIESLRDRCANEGVGALLVCNPHNPTGRVLDRTELELLAELACRFDLLVISDEIHADLILEGRHLPIAALDPEIAGRTVTIGSASKAFNLAGLRCAVMAFGEQRQFAAFDSIPEAQRGGIGLPGLLATVAAFEEGDGWLAEVLAYLRANRDRLGETLRRDLPEVVWYPGQGTYLAWLDLRAYELGDDPAARLLASRIVLAAGPSFGAAGRGRARLNFATPRPILDELIRRLASGCGGSSNATTRLG